MSKMLKVFALATFVNLIVLVSILNASSDCPKTNGSANITETILRLTNDYDQAGSAFCKIPSPINAKTSFSTFFKFQIHGLDGTDGADGFAFVIHNDPRKLRALGASGGSLGYGDTAGQEAYRYTNATLAIVNSLAVEFDTFENDDYSTNDPNDNHIGININGSVDSVTTYTPGFDLNSGNKLFAWIDYDGSTNLLEVYINTTSTKPASPQLTYTVDLHDLVGDTAFIGFTAGTGGLANYHDIIRWKFNITN